MFDENIQKFIDKIDEVSGWTLMGRKSFEELFKLKLYKELLTKHFSNVEVGGKVQNYDELQKIVFHGFITLHLNITDEHKELNIRLNEDRLIFTEYKDIQELT